MEETNGTTGGERGTEMEVRWTRGKEVMRKLKWEVMGSLGWEETEALRWNVKEKLR
jgi:hypothetical protein